MGGAPNWPQTDDEGWYTFDGAEYRTHPNQGSPCVRTVREGGVDRKAMIMVFLMWASVIGWALWKWVI